MPVPLGRCQPNAMLGVGFSSRPGFILFSFFFPIGFFFPPGFETMRMARIRG
jgi:hypothetical protein